MTSQLLIPYIEIKFQTSKFAWIISLGCCLAVLYLVSCANIFTGYKLAILSAISLSICLDSHKHFWQRPTKLDLLLWINKAVIWQNNRVVCAKICNLQAIGNLVVVLTLATQLKKRRILIFYDSTLSSQYKHLMRYLRWHN